MLTLLLAQTRGPAAKLGFSPTPPTSRNPFFTPPSLVFQHHYSQVGECLQPVLLPASLRVGPTLPLSCPPPTQHYPGMSRLLVYTLVSWTATNKHCPQSKRSDPLVLRQVAQLDSSWESCHFTVSAFSRGPPTQVAGGSAPE